MAALIHTKPGAIRQPIAAIAAIAAVALTILMIVVAVERITTAARWAQVGLGSALWDGISTALVVIVPVGLGIWKRKTITTVLRDQWETVQVIMMERKEAREKRRADKAASRIAQHDPDIRSSDNDDTGYGYDVVEDGKSRSAKFAQRAAAAKKGKR